MHPAANILAFQAGWFACVLGAAQGHPWVGVAVTLVVVGLHMSSVARPGSEARLVAVAVSMGLVLDSLLVTAGWLTYPNGQFTAGMAPYWILAMWALFATTLNVSLRWMRNRYSLAALLGLVGGPLSYLAGERLGAVQFADTFIAAIALAVGWGVAMPLLVKAAERFDGVAGGPGKRPVPARAVR